MDCSNWPPPLPSLPLYPPCPPPPPPPREPEPKPVQPKESQTREWWSEYLGPSFIRASGHEVTKKGITYELTRRQRRQLLPIRTQTREDKLIWSVPLPEGSYPRDGLPIWERLYLDRKLPMLKCPPDALVFARQKIGKKLWKDTEGQEFILYDPHSYEVKFSYENIHDPNLTTYYQGEAIRKFLLNVGDATEDGWGLCSLKRFNQYRKYLKRVHLSLVHTEMERQEALKNEIHKLKVYKEVTDETMAKVEQKTMMDEMRAAIVEALRQERLNRINRLLADLQAKEEKIRKLYRRRARERERQRQRGLRLLAQQELKNKIAKEIQRRKKIATLRMWHDTEEKTMKSLKKITDERARQRAEKVRIRWQNKIETLRKMFEKEDEYVKLQEKVRSENIEIRKAWSERLKQQEKDRFQHLRKESLRKKALIKREREDKRMEKAIIDSWISVRPKTQDYDLGTELYRVKKSINSTMAELLASQMEGPDRLSIILLSRNRIQREQKIPLQVSFAIDAVLETAIQKWADTRLILLIETVIAEVTENGRKELARIKAKYKDTGVEFTGVFKASDPRGKIFQPDPPRQRKASKKKLEKKQSTEQTFESTTNEFRSQDETSGKENEKSLRSESEKEIVPDQGNNKGPTAVIPNYVHSAMVQPLVDGPLAGRILPITAQDSYLELEDFLFMVCTPNYGPVITHEYPPEYETEEELKPIAGRPKTPMPTQEVLCQAGFLEEKLKDILPAFLDDVMDMKEKRKFRKVFKNVTVQLFKRAIAITSIAFDPVTRVRAVNKLVYLGDIDKINLTNTLSSLIMNMEEKAIYGTEEFEWLAKAVAKTAIKEVLNPPVLHKEPDDCVARTKIMFYAPKHRRLRNG